MAEDLVARLRSHAGDFEEDGYTDTAAVKDIRTAADALVEQAETIERLHEELTIARVTSMGPIQHYVDRLRATLQRAAFYITAKMETTPQALAIHEELREALRGALPTESAKAAPGVMDVLELQAKTDAAVAKLNPLVKCPTCGMGYFKHPMQD